MEFRILELFSGIGGMHYAFEYSKQAGVIVSAMDINNIANLVYSHNHKNTPVLNNNIQSLTSERIQKMEVNTILMSPPCQPHTRTGKQLDMADNRSNALEHICQILPKCPDVRYLLMENVKGFEKSNARQCFVEALEKSGFNYREFIVTPTMLGVPNTRHRYYCLARKDTDFTFEGNRLWQEIPVELSCKNHPMAIGKLLESETTIPMNSYLSEKILNKYIWLLDIVTANSHNTNCFTKAYTHYSEGTGSIYTSRTEEEVNRIFKKLKCLEGDEAEQDKLKLLKTLKLRYFTPREVSRLMSFPESFEFPAETTLRQKYRLLGNSINVCVVGELLNILCS